MRARPALVFCTLLVGGCADLLGIPDRYYDGGVVPTDAQPDATDDAVVDAPSPDAPPLDGSPSCGTCAANGSGCEVIACHQNTPTPIVVAGSRVFWANSSPLGSNNAVMSSDPDGANPAVAYLAGSNEVPSLVAIGNDVYASTFFGGSVVWMPAGGGSGQPIASASYADALGVDALNHYLVIASFTSSGGVYQCAPNPPQACPSYEPVTGQSYPQGAAVDANNVYWSTTTNGPGIFSCPLAVSCSAPMLVVASPNPALVAVDGTFVYWVDGDFNGSTLWRADKTNGTNKIGLGSAPSSILGFVLDGSHVYYASIGTSGNGSVVRVNTDGTSSTTLASNLQSAGGVAVDATYAYFTEWGPFLEGGTGTDGRVLRVPK